MGTLTAKQEKLLLVFKTAIEREIETQEMYREALLLNDDPAIKRIVDTFIRQEKQHEDTLLKMYNELRTTGEFKDAT
jgi:rubrerythrin